MKYKFEDLMPVTSLKGLKRNRGYFYISDLGDVRYSLLDRHGLFPSFKYVVPIPSPPDEVKPLAYPENKPSENGVYLIHHKQYDEWYEWHTYHVEVWNCFVDYFIPIRLHNGLGR
jgi:hypothetical protein